MSRTHTGAPVFESLPRPEIVEHERVSNVSDRVLCEDLRESHMKGSCNPLQDSTGNIPPMPIDTPNNTTKDIGNPQADGLHDKIIDSEVTPLMNRIACFCYLTFMIGTSSINTYYGYIFSEKGVSKDIIGVLLSIIPIASVTVLPGFSFIVDKYRCAILMLVLTVVCSTIMVWFYTTAANHTLLMITFTVLVILQTPINPLLDRNMLALFPSQGDKATRWAFVRAFGAIGWGVGSLVASAVASWAKTWSMGVVQYTVGHAGMLLCIWLLHRHRPKSGPASAQVKCSHPDRDVPSGAVQVEKLRECCGRAQAAEDVQVGPENAPNGLEDAVAHPEPGVDGPAFSTTEEQPVKARFADVIRVVVRRPRLLVLLLGSAAMGMGYSVINAFLFVFLGEIDGSIVLFGLTVVLTVSTEVPVFIYFDLIQRYFTARAMMTIAMGLWAFRVVGYSLLHEPWLVLPLEPLHGITFGLMWLPAVRALSAAFPAHLSASATGVLFFFVMGIGSALGCITAGLVNEAVGSRLMFRIAAIAMLVVLVCYQVADRVLEALGWELDPSMDSGLNLAAKEIGRGEGALEGVACTPHGGADERSSNNRNPSSPREA